MTTEPEVPAGRPTEPFMAAAERARAEGHLSAPPRRGVVRPASTYEMNPDEAAAFVEPDHQMTRGPWREPREETVGLYPNLVVHDGRLGGAIMVGRSRLPVSAIFSTYFRGGWDDVVAGWPEVTDDYGFTENDLYRFFRSLTELRGEFGRLLLVLAEAERWELTYSDSTSWWETEMHRERVADQLRRCLRVVEGAP